MLGAQHKIIVLCGASQQMRSVDGTGHGMLTMDCVFLGLGYLKLYWLVVDRAPVCNAAGAGRCEEGLRMACVLLWIQTSSFHVYALMSLQPESLLVFNKPNHLVSK